jgi:hypothetical protein
VPVLAVERGVVRIACRSALSSLPICGFDVETFDREVVVVRREREDLGVEVDLVLLSSDTSVVLHSSDCRYRASERSGHGQRVNDGD